MLMDFDALAVRPPPDDAVLWRYFSLLDLVPQLHERTLNLICLNRFPDKFEATVPRANFLKFPYLIQQYRKNKFGFETHPPSADRLARVAEAEKLLAEAQKECDERKRALEALHYCSYASCWVCGPESDAMWRLYCHAPGGIAIKTTFGKLKAAFAHTGRSIRLGMVEYFNYKTEEFPDDNLAYSSTEQERRFPARERGPGGNARHGCIQSFAFITLPPIEHTSPVVGVNFDFETAIEAIVANPYDDPRYSRAAVDILERTERRFAALMQESDLSLGGLRG
jgi:hypothetical protein